ncbi:hypothetical protein [Synechococcus sp. EJ6-Ellesmere]|uniref:hypothetical protein n=1 Tax=Synechococcus sp. EJ6-Ellesmere TaxID=2823734 RepID=UPI0020CF0193|nr:hypothetical protein [Synechococcus sp. EJ6-Ellesmere]MCP9825584.1 hypothetical protein [Synechococcus sp. EJ6-Ellesmere]
MKSDGCPNPPKKKNHPRVSLAGDNFIPCLTKKALGGALGAVVSLLVFADSQVQAVTVNVGGLDYEVTTFFGSYNGDIAKFETAANGGVMPWWGSQANASAFALAVGTSLGTPNFDNGPFFTYGLPTSTVTFSSQYQNGTIVSPFGIEINTTRTFAQATLVQAVPGPLPALGLVAVFGFSRKLKKRIKLHKVTSNAAATPAA